MDKTYHVAIKTNKGYIMIDLFSDVPNTVQNFLKHVRMGYYNNTTFHRVTSWCVQAGRPNPHMPPYDPKPIPPELTYHRHGQYSVAMADAGLGTATTHFFINKAENNKFNNRYIVFGTVIKGMNVLWNIKQGDEIKQIFIEK